MNREDPQPQDNAIPGKTRIPLELIGDWENLIVESHYSIRNLAARCGFSVRHLQRYILNRYRKKLSVFVAGIRMQKAYNLLACGFTVKETALGLGFKQVSHFCRCFKKYYDANPSTVLLRAQETPDSDPGQQLNLEFFQLRESPPFPPKKARARKRKPDPK